MTCCLGIEDGPVVWLGADSAGTDEDKVQDVVTAPKAWEVNGWGFAIAGSFRIGAVLRYGLKPTLSPRRNLDKFIQMELIPHIRELLSNEDLEEVCGTELMIATRGALYSGTLHGCTFTRSLYGYAAIGVSDSIIALGATEDMSPRKRLLKVLSQTSKHKSVVRPPFTVIKIG